MCNPSWFFSLFIFTLLTGKSLGKELDTFKMEILFYSQLEKLPLKEANKMDFKNYFKA